MEDYIFPIDQMVGEYDDFIALWHKFIPDRLCDRIIEKMDYVMKTSLEVGDGLDQFPHMSLGRSDKQIILNDFDADLTQEVNQYLKCCLKHYCNTYSQLLSVKLASYTIKGQRTSPGGGYHEWHYENAAASASNRELVWTIYLNTMPDGEAETEFLYQRRRVRPKKGTVCVFPAGLTHVHKGNTVFTEDKYILTGWALKTQ